MVVREAIQKLLIVSPANHFKQTIKDASVVLARDGKCDIEMKIRDEHMHISGNLHTALSCLLVDVISCCALITHPRITDKLSNPKAIPATITLHTSYHGTAKAGDVMLVQANVIRTSGAFGFVETCIRDKITRNILVKGQVIFIINDQLQCRRIDKYLEMINFYNPFGDVFQHSMPNQLKIIPTSMKSYQFS